MAVSLQEIDGGFDDRKVQTQAPRQLVTGQFAREMQRLERELDEQVGAEPRFLRR